MHKLYELQSGDNVGCLPIDGHVKVGVSSVVSDGVGEEVASELTDEVISEVVVEIDAAVEVSVDAFSGINDDDSVSD